MTKIQKKEEQLLIRRQLNRIISKKIEQVRSSNHQNIIYIISAGAVNPNTTKDTKKTGGTSRVVPTEDAAGTLDDQITPEAPKMIVFGIIPHLQPAHISSYTETADRSERLRHYNLNDTFSTSILLTSIRDIPLEPPPPTESIPAWKLIRPRKPKILPHAEPISEFRIIL
jgi:hypothetical protein